MDDPYVLLGVARDAKPEQIKKAYHKLARALHPDVNPDNRQAEERFKKVSAAYDLLSDQAKRARFDAGEIDATGAERGFRANRARGAAAGAGAGPFGATAEDIFDDLMRRRAKGRSRPWSFFDQDGGPAAGMNATYSLKITLEEAVNGATKRINLPNGRNLDIKVPPGSKHGSTLRLKGQGNPGVAGGPAGDAMIELDVASHEGFTRQGDDILLTLAVSLPEAVLGAKVKVPTIDGTVNVTVPPGSNSGTVLRLKGKGSPGEGGRAGDQLVTLKVMLPDPPDAELEQFLRQWSLRHPYDVRGKT